MPSANAFPQELGEEIFAHILNKALNNRMVDPNMIFIGGTHMKASVNKKKFQKEQVAKAAKVYKERKNWVRKSTMTMMTKIREVPEEERLRKRCPKPTRTAECL